MPYYDHLQLVRLPERLERRRQGGGHAPVRDDPGSHCRKLHAELDTAVAEQRRRRPPQFVDPSLILRVRMSGMTLEEEWANLGLTLLASDEDKTLILFSSSDDLQGFRERLDAYARGTPPGQAAPSYNNFIGRIEQIGAVEPHDRIGIRLREEGFREADDFREAQSYVFDVELWDLGREMRARKLDQVITYIETNGGNLLDRYVGPSITMVRVRVTGAVVRTLLGVEEIATIDLPPEPDMETGAAMELTLPELPQLEPLPDNAPTIGIIDSGVNDHPLLAEALMGAIGVPPELGTADDWGHGTRVSGVAVFGNLREQLSSGILAPAARLVSAKVVNAAGRFDDRRLVPSQMREAFTTLNSQYGCRLFVLALGDDKQIYAGGKVGPWAATLDELARELDSVIVVAAGNNRQIRSGDLIEEAVTQYPTYLLESANRLCEPAGAMNVLTVGALANGSGLGPEHSNELPVRPITRAMEPSPFTRVGPGIGGSCKPDLVDVGGTLVFDALVVRLRDGKEIPAAGVLTLHHMFVNRLFTAASGTSYAAPLVAHKAAGILARFPRASANLVRALLAGSAEVPREAESRLRSLGGEAIRSVCGQGQVNPDRAAYSEDNRVIFYAEDELPLDHFAVYQLPIPDLFQDGGRRHIRVTLAFDPPVRHTRADYAGVRMNFRLIRGCDPSLIFDHFRRRTQQEGRQPDLENRFNCALEPGPRERETGTLQSAVISFSRDTSIYGNNYYLVVRAEGGWASNFQTHQRFAVVVELAHEAQVQLYARLRARVRVSA
jgi:subtilisin family serine protease